MGEDQPREERPLQVAATASSEAEADLISQRLAEAGINAISQRSIGGPEWGVSGAQYVYVELEDLERAREVLSSSEGVSEEELARLSEQAAGTQTTQPGEDQAEQPEG